LDQKQLKHIIWSYKGNLRQEEQQPDYVLLSSVLQQEVTQQRLSWWWWSMSVSLMQSNKKSHAQVYFSTQLYSPHQFNLI